MSLLLELFGRRPEWMANAKCQTAPTGVDIGQWADRWDVDRLPKSPYNLRHDTAAALCEGYPVIAECAQWALDTDQRGMVYAGGPLTAQSGKLIRADRARLAARFGLEAVA